MTMITESRAEARALVPTGLLALIAGHIAAYRRGRNTLRELAVMEDHILRDIGLSRSDVIRASIAGLGEDRIAMLARARNRQMD